MPEFAAPTYGYHRIAMNQWNNGQLDYGALGNGNQQFNYPQATSQPFNPASLVPSKRAHDASPVQNNSRSQTPSFAFGGQQGAQFSSAPTPFSHLQQSASNNGTPSPTLQNTQYRPSPSPYIPQAQQQQANFNSQMSPQNPNQGLPAQQNQMSNANPRSMMNMQGGMGGMGREDAQKNYQMRLLQQQQQMRASGMMPPQRSGGQNNQAFGASAQQQMSARAMNGQGAGQMDANQAQQQQQNKRQNFLKMIQTHVTQQGRTFNPVPIIGGKSVDLFGLWTITVSLGGSQNVERNNQWVGVAGKLGFPQQMFPGAAEELKMLFMANLGQYEKMYMHRLALQKEQQARQHAQQMAGVGGPAQASPTRTMQMPNQSNQFPQFQQGQQNQLQGHATPVQVNAQLPQNGMSTPQQQMLQHRRNSSVRRPEQMTPHAANQGITAPSPHSVKSVQRSPSVKQEVSAAVMKSEEPQSSNYAPAARSIESDGGYDIPALFDLGQAIAKARPDMPAVSEMGLIDIKPIKLSLASGIHSEVRYALDTLAQLSHETLIQFDLSKCEDLIDVIVDCAEEQTDTLSDEAAEVSDALDLPSYDDVVRGSRVEADSLQDVPQFGSQAYELDRAAEKLIAVTIILRNFSFFEHNHPALTSGPVVKWLSNTIRLLGTRNMLLRTFLNAQDFYKDVIIFLSNITQSLELSSREDALHVLHFLLAFAPQPAPSYTGSGAPLRFTSFVPISHRYLPPAIDCLAKLLARQDPNRQLYRSIFTASPSTGIAENPLDLLTRAFALAVSCLPDRSKGALGNSAQLRIVEMRKAFITQGMLAADILTTLLPNSDGDLARIWLESEDGWAVGLLNLAALLSVDRSQMNQGPKGRELSMDTESFKLITHRALTMMKRLAERAGKGGSSNVATNGVANDGSAGKGKVTDVDALEARVPKWEGIPQAHAILGALTMKATDKTALGLLCSLHDMAMAG